MQKYMIIFTTACCVILAAINFYLNYRLYEIVKDGDETAVVNADYANGDTDAYLALSGSYESYYTEPRGLPEAPIEAAVTGQPPVSAEKPPIYRLGMQDGFITVYYGGGTVKEVTAIPADALPFDEKLRLNEGIPVFDEAELARLLQDYGS